MSTTPVVASPQEFDQLRSLTSRLDDGDRRCFLVDANGEHRVEIPRSLFLVLAAAARELAQGHSVVISHYDHELTTQQAADLLNVSRPHLISLLEQGRIRFHRVGTHRRVRMGDLLAYKDDRDERRRAGLREVIRASEALGLYEDEAPDGHKGEPPTER